ncbi:MAG: hypothetical protein JEZ08_16800 [Clostridiales bacterium]|nr:hypothetical protein [Clostridiales bacterium]
MKIIIAALFSSIYILIALIDHVRLRKTKESAKLLQKKIYMADLLTYYFAVIVCGIVGYYFREYVSSSLFVIMFFSMVPVLLPLVLELDWDRRLRVVLFMSILSFTFMINMFLFLQFDHNPSTDAYLIRVCSIFVSMLTSIFFIRYYTMDHSIRTFRIAVKKTVNDETRSILLNMFISDILMEHRKESYIIKGMIEGKYKEVKIPFEDIGHIEFVFHDD